MNKKIIILHTLRTKEDDIMCDILKKLKGKTASDLLQEYNIPLVPPIDVSLLLTRIGIAEIPTDFTEIEKLMNYNQGDILGAIYARNNSLGIFYRYSDTLNRKRFTMAHEIAHCCLDADSLEKRHLELRNCQTSNNVKEKNANIFAGELLMPLPLLEKIHSQFIIAPSLASISKIFNVSTTVMAARLDYLNMPYIKDQLIDEN
jgi:hypothetical protein